MCPTSLRNTCRSHIWSITQFAKQFLPNSMFSHQFFTTVFSILIQLFSIHCKLDILSFTSTKLFSVQHCQRYGQSSVQCQSPNGESVFNFQIRRYNHFPNRSNWYIKWASPIVPHYVSSRAETLSSSHSSQYFKIHTLFISRLQPTQHAIVYKSSFGTLRLHIWYDFSGQPPQ